jgi:hypothetical protein
MTTHRACIDGRVALRRLSWASACALALAMGSANAAVTTVYKCFDRNLDVVYTDQPCRGEQLRIEGGSTDPVAVAELQREREAVARAAAQRVAELRRVDVTPQYAYGGGLPPQLPMPDYGYGGYGNDGYYPLGYGYAPDYGDRRGRGDQARHNGSQRRQSHVPAPPGNLIKR